MAAQPLSAAISLLEARDWYARAKRTFPGMRAIDAEIAALKADPGL